MLPMTGPAFPKVAGITFLGIKVPSEMLSPYAMTYNTGTVVRKERLARKRGPNGKIIWQSPFAVSSTDNVC